MKKNFIGKNLFACLIIAASVFLFEVKNVMADDCSECVSAYGEGFCMENGFCANTNSQPYVTDPSLAPVTDNYQNYSNYCNGNYETESCCQTNGGYWYNSICNTDPQKNDVWNSECVKSGGQCAQLTGITCETQSELGFGQQNGITSSLSCNGAGTCCMPTSNQASTSTNNSNSGGSEESLQKCQDWCHKAIEGGYGDKVYAGCVSNCQGNYIGWEENGVITKNFDGWIGYLCIMYSGDLNKNCCALTAKEQNEQNTWNGSDCMGKTSDYSLRSCIIVDNGDDAYCKQFATSVEKECMDWGLPASQCLGCTKFGILPGTEDLQYGRTHTCLSTSSSNSGTEPTVQKTAGGSCSSKTDCASGYICDSSGICMADGFFSGTECKTDTDCSQLYGSGYSCSGIFIKTCDKSGSSSSTSSSGSTPVATTTQPIKLPDGTVAPAGTKVNADGSGVSPTGTIYPAGSFTPQGDPNSGFTLCATNNGQCVDANGNTIVGTPFTIINSGSSGGLGAVAGVSGYTTVKCGANFTEIGGVCFPTNTGLSSAPVYVILSNIFSWIMGLFTTLAVLAFVISGVQYLMSAGDESLAKSAKTNATNALIGIIVGLSGFIIIKAIAAALSGQGYFF